jgi:hypothetical protein
LYSKLKETAISKEEMNLLSSSSTLGKRETKREALKRLLQRERAGMALTKEEVDLLYSKRGEEEPSIPITASVEKPTNHNLAETLSVSSRGSKQAEI